MDPERAAQMIALLQYLGVVPSTATNVERLPKRDYTAFMKEYNKYLEPDFKEQMPNKFLAFANDPFMQMAFGFIEQGIVPEEVENNIYSATNQKPTPTQSQMIKDYYDWFDKSGMSQQERMYELDQAALDYGFPAASQTFDIPAEASRFLRPKADGAIPTTELETMALAAQSAYDDYLNAKKKGEKPNPNFTEVIVSKIMNDGFGPKTGGVIFNGVRYNSMEEATAAQAKQDAEEERKKNEPKRSGSNSWAERGKTTGEKTTVAPIQSRQEIMDDLQDRSPNRKKTPSPAPVNRNKVGSAPQISANKSSSTSKGADWRGRYVALLNQLAESERQKDIAVGSGVRNQLTSQYGSPFEMAMRQLFG